MPIATSRMRRSKRCSAPAKKGGLRRVVGDRWKECHRTFMDSYETAHALCPEPFSGISGLLTDLAERGIRTALVTGKGARSAEVSLRRLNLADHFDSIET